MTEESGVAKACRIGLSRRSKPDQDKSGEIRHPSRQESEGGGIR